MSLLEIRPAPPLEVFPPELRTTRFSEGGRSTLRLAGGGAPPSTLVAVLVVVPLPPPPPPLAEKLSDPLRPPADPLPASTTEMLPEEMEAKLREGQVWGADWMRACTSATQMSLCGPEMVEVVVVVFERCCCCSSSAAGAFDLFEVVVG